MLVADPHAGPRSIILRGAATGSPGRDPNHPICPETLGRITKFSEHEANRSEAQEGEPLSIEIFPIFGEPAATIEPGDGALDDPAFWQHLKSFCPIGALDDFGFNVWQYFRQAGVESGPLISSVGNEFLQERVRSEQGRKQ